MSVERPQFRRNQSDADAIVRHLEACSDSFVPPLHGRVAIPAYADKLAQRAERFEAWEEDRLVGLVAIYCSGENDAFVSNVSVVPDAVRQGIGRRLVTDAIAHSRRCAEAMTLQVDRRAPALALYRSVGFAPEGQDGDTLTLRLDLRQDAGCCG
ncbi:GNAT family N-acetyltransferase [Methylobacterium komagatae]|uniref:GNAT family N-acetyltransferase n=1 Tax=Methylobacterium komagatae TaxID=374425 RepID=A0ABW2BSU5_9HYPH